jgi:hypothetical protein
MISKEGAIELILEAYRETGLTPVYGMTVDIDRDCACPMGALFKYKTGEDVNNINRTVFVSKLFELLGWDTNTISAFMNGFDFGVDEKVLVPTQYDVGGKYFQAWEIGIELRKLLKPLSPLQVFMK